MTGDMMAMLCAAVAVSAVALAVAVAALGVALAAVLRPAGRGAEKTRGAREKAPPKVAQPVDWQAERARRAWQNLLRYDGTPQDAEER